MEKLFFFSFISSPKFPLLSCWAIACCCNFSSLSGLAWVSALSSGVWASCGVDVTSRAAQDVFLCLPFKPSQPPLPEEQLSNFVLLPAPQWACRADSCLCLFTCPGVPPSFPCGETGDTDTSVLQVKDNQSTAPMHRACPSLKGISLSMLDLPLLVNQYYFFLIIFLSFWCLEMFSLRSGSIIFAGTEVKL